MSNTGPQKIDGYAHISPARYTEALRTEFPGFYNDILGLTPPLFDLEARFKVMDEFAPLKQVLPIGPVPPLEGRSLRPIFAGGRADPSRAIFWEHEGNRAVRLGPWKLVARQGEPWELYNAATDRTESRNLAAGHPDEVKKLSFEFLSSCQGFHFPSRPKPQCTRRRGAALAPGGATRYPFPIRQPCAAAGGSGPRRGRRKEPALRQEERER